ncbi:hypothetical protein O0L34_g7103 [Tuta absoluta]|nr:hypothetical protein O0L34_g7103 [Tuta absoluta]
MNKEVPFELTREEVNALPLRPPQQLVHPAPAVRRPWHPIMWDDTLVGGTSADQKYMDAKAAEDAAMAGEAEYPHKARLRNLRRLIKEGKVKPDQEMLIFFLCNKFAVSEERESKVAK